MFPISFCRFFYLIGNFVLSGISVKKEGAALFLYLQHPLVAAAAEFQSNIRFCLDKFSVHQDINAA